MKLKTTINSSGIAKILSLACILALSVGVLGAKAETSASVNADIRAEVVSPKPKLGDRIEKNKEMRNEKVQEYKEIRAEKRDEMKDARADFKDDRKEMRASTTAMFKAMKDQKREMVKKMQRNVFEARKNALVKELNFTFNNLTNISGRINEKIAKLETEGKVVTDARVALTTADGKLAQAKIAIDAFSAINYTAPGTTASSTSSTSANAEVELEKPRQAGDAAIKAVKEARDAFKKVLEIINSIK